jgi:hypothetical protein
MLYSCCLLPRTEIPYVHLRMHGYWSMTGAPDGEFLVSDVAQLEVLAESTNNHALLAGLVVPTDVRSHRR